MSQTGRLVHRATHENILVADGKTWHPPVSAKVFEWLGVFHVQRMQFESPSSAAAVPTRTDNTTRIVTRHFRPKWIIALVDGTQIIKPPQPNCPCFVNSYRHDVGRFGAESIALVARMAFHTKIFPS
jgi:hypothetical protein